MKKYQIKINPRAVRELNEIYEYIASDKMAPQNVRSKVNRIKKEILNLDTFPYFHQERNEGIYARKGYHQLLIDNYIVVYKIDENNKTVYIITIQYQGRNL